MFTRDALQHFHKVEFKDWNSGGVGELIVSSQWELSVIISKLNNSRNRHLSYLYFYYTCYNIMITVMTVTNTTNYIFLFNVCFVHVYLGVGLLTLFSIFMSSTDRLANTISWSMGTIIKSLFYSVRKRFHFYSRFVFIFD